MTALVVLGATGSIGTQTLEVARRLGIPIAGVASARPSAAIRAIAAAHPDSLVAVAAPGSDEADMQSRLGDRVAFGEAAVTALARLPDCTVVNGIVGAAGLGPTVAALEVGNRVALANKESLVTGGPVVAEAQRRGGGEVIPVDSEHSAIWQVLVGEDVERVRRIILTASGGPFRGRSRADLTEVTPQEALDHPTWDMGPRITIDSATLMNKAFEVIEAHHLFGLDYDAIDVVVHPQSIVHSLVEFVDGVVTAELGEPDMRVPIQYAITYPQRRPAAVSPLDLAGMSLTFERPDTDTFRALEIGYEAGRRGGSSPAVLNAADEVAVAAFLDHRIGFLDIADVVAETLDRCETRELGSVADVAAADGEARAVASEVVASRFPRSP